MRDRIIYPIRYKTKVQERLSIRDIIYDSLVVDTIMTRVRYIRRISIPINNDRNISHHVCYKFGELKPCRLKKSGLRTAMNKPENKRNVLMIAKQRAKNQTNAIRHHLVANFNSRVI